jgi:hypothetical protein
MIGDGAIVAGAVVAVAGGLVAVGDGALLAGFGVDVGSGALLLFAVAEEGFLVAVAVGLLLEAVVGVLVAVGVADGRACAAPGAAPLSSSSRSSGAAGGGFNSPSDNGEPTPSRFSVWVGASVSDPPNRPVTTRLPAMISVPPATNVMAIALGLITALQVPRIRGFPGGHVRVANRRECCQQPPFPGGDLSGSLLLVIVIKFPYLTLPAL